MKIICQFVISIVLFAGCGSTIIVNNKDFTYEDLNRKLAGEKVELGFIDGRKIWAHTVNVRLDSTSYIGEISGKGILAVDTKVSTDSLRQITNKRYDRGAAKGLAFGTLIGATIGFLVGYTSYDESDTGFFTPNSPQEAGGFAAMFYGALGGCLGLLGGAMGGDHETFYFPRTKIENPDNVEVEITKIIKKDLNYIIVLWQGKEIHLVSSEYKQIAESRDGKIYITVSKEIYAEKFK